ncbi:MAG: 1-phosphofructokinase, partial [Clostridia bacterium]|nr:1-phosphofructokinase [Clostridia bacterium]
LKECRAFHEKGVEMICLSLGPEGALLSTKDQAYFCPAADVPVLGTQGAGDSMLGGLLCALSKGETLPEALQFASAAAGASIMRPGTLLCTGEGTRALLPGLKAVEL